MLSKGGNDFNLDDIAKPDTYGKFKLGYDNWLSQAWGERSPPHASGSDVLKTFGAKLGRGAGWGHFDSSAQGSSFPGGPARPFAETTKCHVRVFT